MGYEDNFLQKSNPFKKITDGDSAVQNIYYGEVVSISDDSDGGIIKVKILQLDNKTTDINMLPDCYPILPKFFHTYPQIGEVVRVFIPNTKLPMRGRLWLGSIISQPQKMGYDSIYTALSTTHLAFTAPEPAPRTYPEADGVYPLKKDIALIGRNNTDVILRDGQLELRAGKHEHDNNLKLNILNPATLTLTYEPLLDTGEYYSSSIMRGDKIALISHDGIPQFKAARVTIEDREKIFNEGHPLGRGDVIVEALNIMRRAIIGHIHGYSALEADKNSVINDLNNINFGAILQKNIVIN